MSPAHSPATPRPVTAPERWREALRDRNLPMFDATAHRRVVLIAAHPDDETLGAAGTLAALRAAGAEIVIVVATDGEAAYPGLGPDARQELARVRRAELDAALRAQGLGGVAVHRLGLPDSRLTEHSERLRELLRPLLATADAYLAPWPDDPHPDHRAAGLAAAQAAPVTAHGWSYPIWMWAWTDPADGAIPWDRAHTVALDAAGRAARRAAVACYASQVDSGPAGATPVLAEGLLDHVDRHTDIVFREPRTTSAPISRFADLYADGNDPWRATSWYERRKRAVVMACLPRERYGLAFEPGCGTGELTLELATRCDRVLAADPVADAVASARARTAGHRGVTVEAAALPDVPPGPVDLAVVSEVLYYLDDTTLDATLTALTGALGTGGDLVSVHWRGWPPEAPRSAETTHQLLRRHERLDPLVEHADEDFLLLVLRRR
ncbi:PIG-L family deacetylase [Pseudonocardia sp. GCM10023141]|uniref:PIG-L family deacetylase n=1 Tax=Pseudonocardia sp. GCM10023141 TaxID=3252653 RepID=UPI00361683A5